MLVPDALLGYLLQCGMVVMCVVLLQWFCEPASSCLSLASAALGRTHNTHALIPGKSPEAACHQRSQRQPCACQSLYKTEATTSWELLTTPFR